MSESAPSWLGGVMRAGFASRAAVYAITGVLALVSVWRGGSADGTKGALASLADDTWGALALAVIAAGLFAYALWRLLDAALDLESYGTDAKGVVARLGMTVTAIVHAALAFFCARLLAGSGSNAGQGGGSGEGGGRAQALTAQVMEQEYGRWLVGAAGLAVVGAGIYYWVKAFTGKYKRDIRSTSTTEKLDPVMKAGLVAHGIVIAVVGGFLVWAAATLDPEKAGGVGQAFDAIRSADYGRYLMAAIAAGLVGFAVYCAIKAIYGIVPRAAESDVKTLGGCRVGEITGRARAALS